MQKIFSCFSEWNSKLVNTKLFIPNMWSTAAFFWDTGMWRILTEISMGELCCVKDSIGKVHKELKVLREQQRWHAKIRYEKTLNGRKRRTQISKGCKKLGNSDLSSPCSAPLHFNSLIYSSPSATSVFSKQSTSLLLRTNIKLIVRAKWCCVRLPEWLFKRKTLLQF